MSQRVLVVDDQRPNREIASALLQTMGFETEEASDGLSALAACSRNAPDLVLLDIMMPHVDGMEVLRRMSADTSLRQIPVIMLTAVDDPDLVLQCLKLGAEDYLTKPLNKQLLMARAQNALAKKELADMREELLRQTQKYTLELESDVSRALREANLAQESVIFALACLAEQRDPETGAHLRRIEHYSKVLLRELAVSDIYTDALNDEFLQNLPPATILHDIGKVGVPDSILLKPGALTPEERLEMQKHTEIGATTLQRVSVRHPSNAFVSLGAEVAMSHHEKWDGSGYPQGLSGVGIPLSARIVAVADVYDALRSKRCYKAGMEHEKAAAILTEESGRHFDPALIDAFHRVESECRAIFHENQDAESGDNSG